MNDGSPSFDIGFKKAIEQYRIIQDEDKENFILIQFLEIFYGQYSNFNKYYTPEMHENHFKNVLSLAYNTIDNNKLLGEIYDIPKKETDKPYFLYKA
jgi:hypothetical protein